MRALLDAHTLIWAVDSPSRLTATAVSTIQDPANELLVSAATIWEIAIKLGLRKLTLSGPYRTWMSQALIDLEASLLPITIDYSDAHVGLPNHHRDPFDRMLVAQALVENIPVVSVDPAFDLYGIGRLW